jgi:hypothetical protein
MSVLLNKFQEIRFMCNYRIKDNLSESIGKNYSKKAQANTNNSISIFKITKNLSATFRKKSSYYFKNTKQKQKK